MLSASALDRAFTTASFGLLVLVEVLAARTGCVVLRRGTRSAPALAWCRDG